MIPNPGLLADEFPSRRRAGMSLASFVGSFMLVIAIIAVLVALLLPPVRRAREPARRSQCKNNLKQISLALSAYKENSHALPPAYTVDENGKPLQSWRTLILPFLDEEALYQTLDLTKAWDDPVHANARQTNLQAYRCPSGQYADGLTTYLAVVTANSCFRPGEPRPLSDITDSHAKTLQVIEVDLEHAVPWMAPTDADEALLLSLSGKLRLSHSGAMHAAFVDGSVKEIDADLPAAKRRALIFISGNDN